MSRVAAFRRRVPGPGLADGSGPPRRLDPVDRVGLGLALALAGWTFASAAWNGGRPIGSTILIVASAACYGVGRLMARHRPILVPTIITAIAAALVAFLPLETFAATAVTGVLGYANAKAAFFIVATVAALMLAVLAKRVVHRVSAVVAAGVFAIVPLATRALAATLVSAALPLAAIVAARRASVRVAAAVGSVALVATVAVTVLIGATGRRNPVDQLLSSRRVGLWNEAFDFMTAHPVLGVGPGRFGAESPNARSDDDTRRAHHAFLQQGAETGVPGFVLLVALFLWGFVRLATAGEPGAAVLTATGLAALGILACFDYLLHFPVFPVVMAALLGTATPFPRRERRWRPGVALRKAAKGAALPWGSVRRRKPGDVVILLYHRVGAGDREIDVPLDLFQRQMGQLVERERVLSLDQALSDGGGVVLSIDDGFADFHDHVLPVLVGLRIPAVLYLATGLVGEGGQALRWSQLEEAISTGLVTVGSHTHSHADLSRASEPEAREEMRRSKGLIEDRLGVECRHFAYPWAVASPAAEIAARTQFDSAALAAWRTNRRGRIDPYRLGRTPVLRNDGVGFFGAKARGMLDGEGFVYRILRRGPWARA
jgi:peptidoglycan/xylan/chitin deacetylase (PgdA/CDA1 family)/O-antigen ligase